MSRFRLVVAAGSLAAALSAGLLAGPATAAPPPAPVPGAQGIGDPLFPGLGNGGYDVTHYSIDMTYRAGDGTVDAAVVVRATTYQALSRFDLDFEGNTIRRVELDGAPVAYAREGSELVVTPRRPLRKGSGSRSG